MSAGEMIQVKEYLPCKPEDLNSDLLKNTHSPMQVGTGVGWGEMDGRTAKTEGSQELTAQSC